MAFDERKQNWDMARKAGRAARLEDEPMSSNPYRPHGVEGEAALFVCWQRGWTEVDRELAASEAKAGRNSWLEIPRKLVVL